VHIGGSWGGVDGASKSGRQLLDAQQGRGNDDMKKKKMKKTHDGINKI
jgi:hypothetical protein